MADTTKSHDSRLVCRVRKLFLQENYAAVCRMQGEIDKWQCAPQLEQTYAGVIYFLASALSMQNAHDEAIRYYKIVYSLHTSFVRSAQTDPGATRDDVTLAELKLAEACSCLARIHSRAGGFEEAQLLFEQCATLLGGRVDNEKARITVMLELGGNSHKLGKHDEAIEIILGVIADAESCSALKECVWASTICPALLVGRCYAALGRFTLAIRFFKRARKWAQARNDREIMGIVELEYGVMVWARWECAVAELREKTQLFRDDDFVGPMTPLHVVEWQIIQLVARACHALGNAPGRLGLNILLNKDGDMVGVRQAVPGTPGFGEVCVVTWEAVESSWLNVEGFPKFVRVQIQQYGVYHLYKCQVHARPVCVQGQTAVTKFGEFIQHTMKVLLHGHPHHIAKNVELIGTALHRAVALAQEMNHVDQRDRAMLFLAFFEFKGWGSSGTCGALQKLHEFLQSQVRDNLNANRCRWCEQRSAGMFKCDSCKVMRFCCKKHQKLAWRPPFGSTVIAHKQICGLLRLGKAISKSHGKQHADVASLSLTYDKAMRAFLNTNIMDLYLEKNDVS